MIRSGEHMTNRIETDWGWLRKYLVIPCNTSSLPPTRLVHCDWGGALTTPISCIFQSIERAVSHDPGQPWFLSVLLFGWHDDPWFMNDDYDDRSLMITVGLHLVSPVSSREAFGLLHACKRALKKLQAPGGAPLYPPFGDGSYKRSIFFHSKPTIFGGNHMESLSIHYPNLSIQLVKKVPVCRFFLTCHIWASRPEHVNFWGDSKKEVIFWRALATGRWDFYMMGLPENVVLLLPSGYVKIAIENGHWNSQFSHKQLWFSIVFCMFTRGYHDSSYFSRLCDCSLRGIAMHSHILRIFTKLPKRWPFQPCCERFFSRKALNLHTMKDPEEHNLEYCTTRNVQELYCWTE